MKIDSLSKTSFEKVDNAGRSAETGLSITDSPMSLSSPFVNPYRKSNNTTTISTGKGKTAAERNNNPFNIKFGNFAAKYGATKENKLALDGGNFATFSSPQVGFQAAKDLLLGKNYRNLTVDQAMKRWSNNGYGGNIFPEVANKRVADLNPTELDNLQKKQIVREDKKYANKLGIYKYGGKLKSFNVGGTVPQTPPTGTGLDPNLVAMGLGLAGTAVESFDTNPKKVNKGAAIAGGALKGAGTGAALGSLVGPVGTAIGAVGGAVVGGIFGGKKANRRQATLNHTSALQNQTFNQQLQDRSTYLYKQMNPYQYKFGGNLGPGKPKPIIVNDKNDPKLKAFRDSARVYNAYVNQLNLDKQIMGSHSGVKIEPFKDGDQFYINYKNGAGEKPLTNLKPIAEYSGLKSDTKRDFVPRAVFKRPTQPVIYQPNTIKDLLVKPEVNNKSTKPIIFQKSKTKFSDVQPIVQQESKLPLPEIEPHIVPNKPILRKPTDGHTYYQNPGESNAAYRKRLDSKGYTKYKFGGNINPEWEAEKNEIVQGDNVILEDGKQITPNLHLVKGKKHEQGGTLGAGGDRVFSNSISFNGQTPAKVALKIGKQLQKFDSNLSSPDRMKRLTAEKMTTKLNEQLDTVFDAQEEFKETPKFKYGGNLPKFKEGGDLEADKRRIKTLENYLRDNPQESGDSKKAIRNEIAKLKSNTSISTGKPWNPLEKKKVLLPLTEKSTAWTNDLDAVTVKGKRSLPGNKSTSGNSVEKSVASSPIKRNNFNSLNNVTTLSPRQSTNPLAKNLENIPVTKVPNQSGVNNKRRIDPTLAAGLGLSAIGYLNTANNIRRMNTDVPVNLIQSPYYGYRDRSRLVRTDLSGVANTVLRDPNVSSANKQALFSRYSQGINQINDQENSNRFQYDNQFAGQALQVDVRNNAMLTQAQQERINNQNMKIAMQSQNFDNLLGGVASTIVDRDKRKLDRDKFSLISDAYKRKYNTNFDVELPE